MPSARPPLMETSENTATPSPAPAPANGTASSRRRSGRERRAPEKFQPEVTIAPKRKRGDEDDENHDPDIGEDADAAMSDNVDEDDDDDDDQDGAEDSPDEEEQRAARRQKKKKGASQPSRAKKPAAKKPKINGTAPATAQSISVGLPSRPKPKKSARVVSGDKRDGSGVYGKDSQCGRVITHTDAKQRTSSGLATMLTMLRAGGTKNTEQIMKRP